MAIRNLTFAEPDAPGFAPGNTDAKEPEMTLPQTPLRQAAIAGIAMLTTAVTFGAALSPAPAMARSGAYYRATLEQPVERRQEIIRGGTFICSGTICVGTQARSRPANVCKSVSEEFGPVASFSVAGTELDAEALAECRAEQTEG